MSIRLRIRPTHTAVALFPPKFWMRPYVPHGGITVADRVLRITYCVLAYSVLHFAICIFCVAYCVLGIATKERGKNKFPYLILIV